MPKTNEHSPPTMAKSAKADRERPKAAEASDGNSTRTSSVSTELALDLTLITAPCVEEDTRFTELQILDRKFWKWIVKGCDCPIRISEEAMQSFRRATRSSIELIGELNRKIGIFEQTNQRLQQDYDQQCHESQQLNASCLQMQCRIQYLERSNESLKVKCNGLEDCIVKEEIAETVLQNLPEVSVLRASPAMVDFRVGHPAGVVFASNPDAAEAEVEHSIESRDAGRGKKRLRPS